MNLGSLYSCKDEWMADMANISTHRTGLPYMVYVCHKFENYSLRIAVRVDGELIPIIVGEYASLNPLLKKVSSKKLQQINKWISLNEEFLKRYWEDEYYTADMF